jgi:protein subunit release factor B
MILRVLRGWMSTSKFTTYKDVILQNHEMKKNYMRSSGPGGQSVNTTNSKAEVRVLIKECSTIDTYIANNIRQKYKQFTNKADELIVTSQIHKSQSQNLK